MPIEIAVASQRVGLLKAKLRQGGVVLPFGFGGARARGRAMTGGGAPLKTSVFCKHISQEERGK